MLYGSNKNLAIYVTYRVSPKSERSLDCGNCVVVRFAMAPNNLSAVNTSLAVTCKYSSHSQIQILITQRKSKLEILYVKQFEQCLQFFVWFDS